MNVRAVAAVFAIAVTSGRAAPVAAAPQNLRVAIYSGTGAESDKTLALYRAVEAIGDRPMALVKSDLTQGRLTRSNFDVFIIPAGEDGKKCCAGHYSDVDALGSGAAQSAIRSFLNQGGGVVGIEAGAYFSSLNGDTLDIFKGNYRTTSPVAARQTMTITDASFGTGTQAAWMSVGGGYFDTLPADVTVVARDSASRAAIVREPYGAGRVVMSAFDLELRGDSELDWTIWDNWAMGSVHPNSAGAWSLLGRMIGWAAMGDSSAPLLVERPNATGSRVAMVATHTTDGGAWPGLLPGLARSIDWSGHVPLAIRFQEIKDGRLTAANFKVVTFPGGYAYGYKTGLSGHEQKIRDFISNGGGYYGICAGSFYAPDTIKWNKKTYPYPLQIYKGQDIGPIDDIAPWPQYALTPIIVNDPVLGNLGTIRQMYYGGGYHTVPTDAAQGTHVSVAATFGYAGSAAGKPDVVRFTRGSGHVLMVTTHPESRSGSTEDWQYWDDFVHDSSTPLVNADNPWTFVDSAFDNWLTLP